MKKIILACICSALPLLSSQSIAATETDFNIAISHSSAVKVEYNEFYQSTGEFPTSEQIEYSPDIDQIEYITSTNNTILVSLSSIFGEKQWISLIPQVNPENSSISYICKTTLNENITGLTDCENNVPYDALDIVVDSSLFISAIIATSATRTQFTENYAITGELPSTTIEAGIDNLSIDTRYFNNVIVEPDTGTIIYGLSPIFGTNQWFTLIPRVYSSGSIGWSCQTTLPDEIKGLYCGASITVDDILE